MPEVFIVGGRRSPIGRFLGSLANFSAPQLGAHVAGELLREYQVKPDAVDEVFIGQVIQAGAGQNTSRQVALNAGVADTVSAVTVNQVCGSGMRAIMSGDRAIRSGDVHVVLAGGVESMSNCPHLLRGLRSGATRLGDAALIDSMFFDGLMCAFDQCLMGETAEYLAEKQRWSRDDQDQYAVQSHLRAARAQTAGEFNREIVPIEIKEKKQTIRFETDECIRGDSTIEAVRKLPTHFKKDGTVTAANASAIADGAAMTLIASGEACKQHGWKPRAKILSCAVSGGPPRDLFTAPIAATRKVLERAKLTTREIDLFEINEAFAVTALACAKGLEIGMDRVNVNGGAISIGHPIGASGTRVVVTLLHALEHRNLKRGVAALCLGGGNAVAICIERS